MNRKEKAELIETLQSTFNASTTVVVAHQVGMTVAESGELRQKMREAGAGFKVTKNVLSWSVNKNIFVVVTPPE